MSIDVIVRRGAGDRIAEDVTAPYATTVEAALSLGRRMLDDWDSKYAPEEVEITYRDGVRLADMMNVEETTTGVPYIGKVRGISHRFSKTELFTTLKVTRDQNDITG